ncbi:hypothetical protein VNO80_13153 [Phaseolus coccineus]|uniref:Uncharacterized protein n=1 Tax=Phaseolus coccineus TaxID=3886 RepID=A0AAN9N190_PHACN
MIVYRNKLLTLSTTLQKLISKRLLLDNFKKTKMTHAIVFVTPHVPHDTSDDKGWFFLLWQTLSYSSRTKLVRMSIKVQSWRDYWMTLISSVFLETLFSSA